MKKLIYLCFAILILTSCESNDDDNNSGSDPIIGKWQQTLVVENGKETSTTCSKKSTYTFSSNGTVSMKNYYEGENDICTLESESASWNNTGNSNYKITFSDGEEGVAKLNFSQNNTVFSTTSTDTYQGVTNTYTETYTKI